VRRWQHISRLFGAASQLSHEEWSPFLARETTEDELAVQVMALLEKDREQACSISRIVSDEASALVRGGDVEAPLGRRIGPYFDLEEIGRGGMGTVYRARRELCGALLAVAIKVIRPGLATEDVLRRFERERILLAGLQHPNIARLVDAGTTDDGRPFLVMDYVEGVPIDVYCARHHLSVRGRIRLFLGVCAAVEHAHRHHVVHRDLKPSNVLVTDDGTPKLLDFGLAKLLETNPSSTDPITVAGLRWLTPEYASPEQAAAGTVATATDVFGLGALLYHLLTGRPPFRFPSYSLADVVRVLRDVDPEPPSRVLSRQAKADDSGNDHSLGLDGKAGRSGRRLSVDLDCIVLEALAKEPAARYASVEALAADLCRYLEGRPVHARRWTWRYHTVRFLGRHRHGAAALAATLIILGISLVACVEQGQEAAQLRELAEAEGARADAVGSFLVDVFESVGANLTGHGADLPAHDLPAHDLLDRGLARARTELGDHPLLQARLLRTLSRSYRRLGLYEQAEELAKEVPDS